MKVYSVELSITYPVGALSVTSNPSFRATVETWADSEPAAFVQTLESRMPLWERWGDLPGGGGAFVPLRWAAFWLRRESGAMLRGLGYES